MNRMIVGTFIFAAATTLVAAAAFAETTTVQTVPTLQAGDQSRWSLDFEARMEQAAAPPIEIHIIGGWTSTVSAVRTGEYDAQLQVADLHFFGKWVKDVPPASLVALERRLSRPVWGTFRNDGGLLSMHFLRETSPSDRNLLQMIATELQIVRPGTALESDHGSDSHTWTAHERDGAGEYVASYIASDPGRVVKRKLRYLHTDGVAGAPRDGIRISIEDSNIAFQITGEGDVQAIDGSNTMRLSLSPDKSGQMNTMTSFHASHMQTGRAPELIGSLERSRPDVVDSAVVTQRPDAEVARAEADERLLKGYKTEVLLESAFAKEPRDAAYPDRLSALLRRRPEAASQAAALLIEHGPQKTVTNALGASGSPSSLAALSSLAHNTGLPENLRVDAILGFIQLRHPTVEAMQVPADLVGDPDLAVQSAARMISGALSRTGGSEHPAEADAIDARLLALCRVAHDAREKADLLAAIGNSARPATIPTIEEALKDSDVGVRSAAARALRLAVSSEADQHLATAIITDSEANVRDDAIFAARFHHPLQDVLTEALLQAASTDRVSYVRGNAIAVLRQNLAGSQRIALELSKIASSDADPSIRKQAAVAMADRGNIIVDEP